MTTSLASDPRAARLLVELTAAGKLQVPLPDVLAAWNRASPELGHDAGRHAALSDALETLAATGDVELPTGAWDRSTIPPLPRFVKVTSRRRPTTARPWRDYPWCAELAWVAERAQLAAGHFDDLVAVNRWLAAGGRNATTTPVQVRSLEVFGDEKRLLDLATKSSLFGAGRLNFDLLACRRYPPPLAHERLTAGGTWLVVENADSFWLARDAARATGAVDVVAWGAGRAVVQSITSLLEHTGAVERLLYWGDIDPDGIGIAAGAAATCRAAGLPDLRPSVGLWDATAAKTVRGVAGVDWSGCRLGWLGAAEPAVSAVAAAHGRVPQEALDGPAIEAVLSTGSDS